MIERASEFGASAAAPLVPADANLQTAGDMLRMAREAHGIDAAVVAAALKVPVQKVEALEAGDLAALPDPVFARALAASMCRALRIDPKPVLEKLPGARQPGPSTQYRTTGTPFRAAPARSSSGGGAGSRILVVVVALLLIGAALMVWLPQAKLDQLSAAVDRALSRSDDAAEHAAAPVAEPPPASNGTANGTANGAAAGVAAGGSAAATSPAVAVPGTGVATAPPGGASAPVSAPPVAAAAPAPVVPAPTAQPAPAPASAPATTAGAAVPPNSVLAFNARAETWISVSDAEGKQLLRRLVQPGENIGLSGALPLTVVVGRAASVDVQVRGKPFDLSSIARAGGVARFEVAP